MIGGGFWWMFHTQLQEDSQILDARYTMFRVVLFCVGSGFLYGSLYILEMVGDIFLPSLPSRLLSSLGGLLLGAVFLWGLAQHARALGRRPVFLALLLANPYSWLAFLLFFIACAAWLSGPDAMNLGVAIGAMAFAFAFIYAIWLALAFPLLRDPALAALFGGLRACLKILLPKTPKE